jgi:hypothetical protein
MPRRQETSALRANKPGNNAMTISTDAPSPISEFRTQTDDEDAPIAMFLEIKVSENDKKTFRLQEGENLIGRTPGCAIRIDDPSLSRQHALILARSGKLILRDLGSRNHTYIDKKPVTGDVEVRPEMRIQFGAVEAVIHKA